MNILYDGHVYRMQPVGGVARYLVNIVNRLPEDWTPVITIGNTNRSEYDQLKFPSHRRLVIRRFPVPGLRPKKVLNWASKRYFSRLEADGHFDLLHSVHHGSLAPRRPRRRRAPFVVTIHDMIPQIYSKEMDPKGKDAELKRQAVESADAVVCVSENTRRDLLERISIPEDRVRVIPLGSTLNQEMTLGGELVPERPYFIFVGARKAPYKNFAGALSAFAQVVEKCRELELCVVGAPFDETECELIHRLKIQDRVTARGPLPDSHLAKLYRHSLALLYPSWYEGFGLPPLEAMACGALAIVSSTSSLPEVTGKAGIIVNPYSTDSLVESMVMVLTMNAEQRQQQINLGLSWSSQFPWSTTVEKTVELYKVLAGSAGRC